MDWCHRLRRPRVALLLLLAVMLQWTHQLSVTAASDATDPGSASSSSRSSSISDNDIIQHTHTPSTASIGIDSFIADDWSDDLRVLASRIVRLPDSDTDTHTDTETASNNRRESAQSALRMVREVNERWIKTLRNRMSDSSSNVSSDTTNITSPMPDWSRSFEFVSIPSWERRVFPNALELMLERPWFVPALHGHSYEDVKSESEGDEEEDEAEQYGQGRPKIRYGNILHVLAGRGFDEAMQEVLSYIPQSLQSTAVNAPCTLSATLSWTGVTPLHILSIYAPDTRSLSDPHGNVASAQLLVEYGANVTAEVDGDRVTPIVLAAERGHFHLFSYFLETFLPSTYFIPVSGLPLSDADKAMLSEWSTNVDALKRDFAAGLLGGTPERFAKHLVWLEEQRAQTEAERRNIHFQNVLHSALHYALMSNQERIVRLLLDGPGSGYGLLHRLDDRLWDGRGDTLLHGAVRAGLLEMTQLLLDYGADPTMLTHDGWKIERLAQVYNQQQLLPLLTEYRTKWEAKHGTNEPTSRAEPDNRENDDASDHSSTSSTPVGSDDTSTSTSAPPSTSTSSSTSASASASSPASSSVSSTEAESKDEAEAAAASTRSSTTSIPSSHVDSSDAHMHTDRNNRKSKYQLAKERKMREKASKQQQQQRGQRQQSPPPLRDEL